LFGALVILAGCPDDSFGQATAPSAERSGNQVAAQAGKGPVAPEALLLSAIRTNPVTAPYPIAVNRRNGVVVLTGVVGTKLIHDVAVRMAIGLGAPFRDDLIIDTAAANQVALVSNANAAAAGALAAGSLASSPYIYPQPLMGRLDDPFFGMVPPILSFPPWWRRNEPMALVQPGQAGNGALPATPNPGEVSGQAGAVPGAAQPAGQPSALGQVEIRVDALGQVVLRGVVASEEVARAIEETARRVPGVTRVDTQLQVQPRRAPAETPPPPPPEPLPNPAEKPPAPRQSSPAVKPKTPDPPPAQEAPAAVDGNALSQRVTSALTRRKPCAALPVKVRSNDGVVTLSGRVPSAYEAMMAYRAAQQTPGVKEIVDQIEFPVPDEDHPNPLVRQGRPEDVEPYLSSQIRRHFGDLAQLDRIQARGNLLELHGTLQHPDDQDRVLAILRSMPLLSGYKIEPVFTAE
jgi:osmotically-inducible protein OsmY